MSKCDGFVRWAAAAAWCSLALGLGVAPAGAAECTQITNWSNQDASYFPVERRTRIDSSNTPGRFYYDLDNVQEKTQLVTYFLLAASPVKTVDQTFSNTVGVTVLSFGSQAAAVAMFVREVDNFNRINPVRWGYKVLGAAEGQQMIYYDDTLGSQEIHYLAPWHNTIVQITLKSASTSEDLLSTGVARMADRILQAHALVNEKCNVNSAPSITLVNAGPNSPIGEFQSVMANGEILIRVQDADGLSQLDWSTFRMFVAGIDKTAHALSVVNALNEIGYVAYTAFPPNEAVYTLRLSRYHLMSSHNLFNIPWNGQWPVDLKICDRKGACTTSSYKLEFGPYVYVSSFEDMRCTTNGADQRIKLTVSFGNNGHSAVANIYAVIGPTRPWQSWSSNFWSLALVEPISHDVPQWFDDSFGLLPVTATTPVDLPSAMTVPDHDQLQLFISTAANRRGASKLELAAGTYTLASGAVDLQQGSVAVQSKTVVLCASK